MEKASGVTDIPIVETALRGTALLTHSGLNKGSAFSDEERDIFALRGLLPPHVSTPEEQLARTYENFSTFKNPLDQNIFLAALQDRNEVLFYRLLQTHIAQMMPVIYTPTVGEACQKYSHIFRRARGLYLSAPDLHRIPAILAAAASDIEVIVVTDGERILGLGDLGVGGMGIPIGKLALYTLCAGIDPRKTLPIMLDVGTNNHALLNDTLYLGMRHPRLERAAYDQFIEAFVQAVKARWPRAILQWEDFSKGNAWRLLQRYKNELATFNDDIQGTAAVTLAGLLRAVALAGRSLKDERIVIVGAGSAATGIADLLCDALEELSGARDHILRNIWLMDTKGLVHQGRADLSPEKQPFAQPVEFLASLGLNPAQPISLEEVMTHIRPTTLIGTSGQAGAFHESLIRRMAQQTPRPIIFPLSNPTSKAEGLPEELMRWSEGRALIATGSPFPHVLWNNEEIPIGQCNNAFIFPGVGLGLIASGARRIPPSVFLAAAKTLAAFDKRRPGYKASLFPNLEDVREVSSLIAHAVGSDILRRGLAAEPFSAEDLAERIEAMTWHPVYPELRRRA